MINEKISPIADKKIEEIFKNQKNNKIIATFNKERHTEIAMLQLSVLPLIMIP